MTEGTVTNPVDKTYDDAYREGYDAYYDGYEFEDNPYPSKSVSYGGWYDGWMEAYTGEGGDYDSR
jgi:hypothetical protein